MVEEDKISDFGDYGDESSDEDDSDGEVDLNANKWVIKLLGKYKVCSYLSWRFDQTSSPSITNALTRTSSHHHRVEYHYLWDLSRFHSH